MTVEANGVRLHAERANRSASAPTLVLAHAFGASSRAWRGLTEALGGAMPTVAVDLRGWGDSEATEMGYAVADMADDLLAITEALGLARWALVGHSMSGKAAVALAARRPAGLESLVLVAPSPPTPEPMPDADRQRLRDAHGDRDACERIVRGVTAQPLTPEAFEHAVDDHLRASAAAWRAWLDSGSREDISDLAAQIRVPTLVVAGGEDEALGASVQREATVRLIPDARLETVSGAAHFVPYDAPEALAAFIRAHVLG